MTYHQNEITADNAPATSAGKGCDSRADEVLAKLKAVPSAPSGVSPLVGSAFDPVASPRSGSPSLPVFVGRPKAGRALCEGGLPMTGGVVNIGYVELVGASLLMLVAGIVSWRMGLGQSRRIAVSTVRAFLQLLAMGLLLGYLFKYQTWWLVCLVLLGMCIAATQIATGPARTRSCGGFGPTFFFPSPCHPWSSHSSWWKASSTQIRGTTPCSSCPSRA